MAQQTSLADKLVLFMRVRDEARSKLDELREHSDLWPTLSMMLEQQEKAAGDALYEATATADRLGRMAEQLTPAKNDEA